MTVWSRIAASVVRLPPPQTTDVSVERDLTAKMPDGVVLLADRWYPTDRSAGQPADRADPHALRAHAHGPARPALRGARLPGRSAELPGDVRLRGRVRPGAQRAGRRAGHARVGGGPALVRRPPRHVGRELPRHDAVGRGAGRAGLRQGARPPGHRVELPRLGRVSRVVRSRSRRRWPGCTRSSTRSSGGAPSCARTCAAPGWCRRRATSCPSGSATPPPSASPCPSTRTGSSTAPRVTRGGTASTSGAGWRRCRRPASSAAGTTCSSRPRWPTTRRSGAPGARPA